MVKFLIVIILTFVFHFRGYSQIVDLSCWKLDSLPTGDRVDSANHSSDNWLFHKNESTFSIIPNDYKIHKGDTLPFSNEFTENLKKYKIRHVVKKVSNGYIVGFDRGEFGGGLYFTSKDGSDRYVIESPSRVKGIFELNSKFYAIEGLSHLGSSSGKILEIYKDTRWKTKTIIHLEEAPYLASKRGNNVYIITDQHLLRLSENIKIDKLLKAPFYWGILHPSSMIFEYNNIYIAMRKGVLKIENFETNPSYKWYLPSNCH